jgi:hypothetical protein
LGIVTLVCQQSAAAFARLALFAKDANLIQNCLSLRRCWPDRQKQKVQGMANPINLGGQATYATSRRI